ncbi:MAG: uroporphyrinogen decarboxylase family protein [Christensenellales bacterium]|jgi:uroporphyrinogen decarboxylase
MTGKERISRILRHEKVDRIGLYEHFWGDTMHEWIEQGHLREGACLEDEFGFDMQECWAFNLTADLDFVPKVVAEDAETVTALDGNGATLRRHKLHDTTPEHIDFSVRDREGWEKIRPLLTPDARRINFEAYRNAKAAAKAAGRFFVWSGINAFECIHPVCGHQYMLIGMADDPEWVQDMAMTYANLTIALQKMLFEREGLPDGIWYYEDMGYKGSPFMSPKMYREIIKPAHVATFSYARSLDLPVIVHSCGFVEPFVPDLIDAGMDCLQVIEVKAGMDPLRLHEKFGEKIALMGGIDVRTLYTNDRAAIDRELEGKIPQLMQGYNFVLHSDHSIPKTVNYETYRYFIEKGLKLGTY